MVRIKGVLLYHIFVERLQNFVRLKMKKVVHKTINSKHNVNKTLCLIIVCIMNLKKSLLVKINCHLLRQYKRNILDLFLGVLLFKLLIKIHLLVLNQNVKVE